MKYLMKCGHVNNSTKVDKDGSKIPYCVICDCDKIDKFIIYGNEGLEGRKARCRQHKRGCSGEFVDSSWNLPLFAHKPNEEYDSYYCGCRGWD